MSFAVRLIVSTLLLFSVHAFAHNPQQPHDLDSKIKSSGLIFVGKVVRIEYRKSTLRGASTESLPHTFVTYSIEKVLKGRTRDREITLRFLGGRGDKAHLYMITEYPFFDVGDVDVLMVKKNGTLACPLVSCRDGRYRMIGGKVYSEMGHEVLLSRTGKTIEGRRQLLPDVVETKISQTTIRRRSVRLPGEEPAKETVKQGTHFDQGAFVTHVLARIGQVHTPDQLRRLPVMESTNANQPFFVTRLIPRPPPRLAKLPVKIERETPAERAEREAFERADENPVLN